MEHPLALAVINDSKSYSERCAKHRTMKRSQYRGYLQALVAKQAHHERVHFAVRYKPAAITQATDELLEYMDMHMSECEGKTDA